MEVQNSHYQERRQFGRVKIPEGQICEVHVPVSRKVRSYQGLIKNISLGGIYLVCDEKPPLKKNDTRYLILNVNDNNQLFYSLKFYALVVRTEDDGSQFPIALKFLSDPIYYPSNEKEIKELDLQFFDKIRIMYKNVMLYKMAYAKLRQRLLTEDERIKNINKLIIQDIYNLNKIKPTH